MKKLARCLLVALSLAFAPTIVFAQYEGYVVAKDRSSYAPQQSDAYFSVDTVTLHENRHLGTTGRSGGPTGEYSKDGLLVFTQNDITPKQKEVYFANKKKGAIMVVRGTQMFYIFPSGVEIPESNSNVDYVEPGYCGCW